MTTKENLLEYVQTMIEQRGNRPNDQPVFTLYLFRNPDKEIIRQKEDGTIQHTGWPDFGGEYEPGFYYNLDYAIEAMNENACDIRETCYNAGFILCKFQGLYEYTGTGSRMYFVWDDEKEGFFQQEEPSIFAHIAL